MQVQLYVALMPCSNRQIQTGFVKILYNLHHFMTKPWVHSNDQLNDITRRKERKGNTCTSLKGITNKSHLHIHILQITSMHPPIVGMEKLVSINAFWMATMTSACTLGVAESPKGDSVNIWANTRIKNATPKWKNVTLLMFAQNASSMH